jgi:hypothetical protein
MPCATRMPQDLTSLYTVRVGRGSQRQFQLIHVSSLICLIKP